MPGHELGASYKPVRRRFTGKVEYPLTPEYERGHVATFGERRDRHCDGCGRLPHFCECKERKERACP